MDITIARTAALPVSTGDYTPNELLLNWDVWHSSDEGQHAGGGIGLCELHPDYWGQGYATEAARAMLAFGFDHLHL